MQVAQVKISRIAKIIIAIQEQERCKIGMLITSFYDQASHDYQPCAMFFTTMYTPPSPHVYCPYAQTTYLNSQNCKIGSIISSEYDKASSEALSVVNAIKLLRIISHMQCCTSCCTSPSLLHIGHMRTHKLYVNA